MKRLSGLFAIGSFLGLMFSRAEPAGTRPAPLHPERAATLTFFTDRAAFSAQFPTLGLEDFELGGAPFGSALNCPGPLDATSGNACFSPGEIKPGIRFNSEQPNSGIELALIGAGLFQAPSQRLVATNFQQAFIIDFTAGDVKTTGMDLVVPVGGSTCQIDVFGASGLLASTTAPCTNPGSFWGVSSDQAITRIRISTPDASEGVDNVAFGAGGGGGTPGPPGTTPVSVVVDVKPGGNPNSIYPRARGVIPVAVLSTGAFDAGQIDAGSVTFGPGGARPAHGGHLEDVNGDGLLDMVFQFRVEESGLWCGDVQATLTGALRAPGGRFGGTDAVRMVNCGRL